jgi:cell division protease FtsH
MGLEREGLHLSDRERRLLAYHEGGHALVAAALQNTDPLHKVSIVPRGQALGITQQLPEKDRYIHDRDYILDRIAVIMGGRAAEEIAMDTATSGAEDDLRQVTKLARKMVLDWGMSDEVGHAAPGGQKEQVFLGEEISRSREYSEETARKVDGAVHELVETAHARAREVLESYRAVLDEVADILLEREEVGGDEVMEMLEAARA